MMNENFTFVNEMLNRKKLTLNSDYDKINDTYYEMFCTHYESFLILIQHHYFSSAIILPRTMLELYVKSYYLESIERKNDTSILDFLEDRKKFPNFFKMVEQLEQHTDILGAKFNGGFKQFTKSGLASYEKFSLFSHEKGEYLKASFEDQKINYTFEQIIDLLKTAKGLFDTLSLLLMYVQNFNDEIKIYVNRSSNDNLQP
jgi:hypothetical protein